MKEEIKGNFEAALTLLIQHLVDEKNLLALSKWDGARGNDWFTSTKLKEQNKSKEKS